MVGLVFSQFFQNLVVSWLELGECDSVDHVLDDLDSYLCIINYIINIIKYYNTFLEGGDFDGHLVVLIGPLLVFGLSLGGPGLDGVDGLFVVSLSLGEVNSGLLQNVFIVGNAWSQSGDGLFVLADFLDQSLFIKSRINIIIIIVMFFFLCFR